jgi:hypothetical protein
LSVPIFRPTNTVLALVPLSIGMANESTRLPLYPIPGPQMNLISPLVSKHIGDT